MKSTEESASLSTVTAPTEHAAPSDPGNIHYRHLYTYGTTEDFWEFQRLTFITTNKEVNSKKIYTPVHVLFKQL